MRLLMGWLRGIAGSDGLWQFSRMCGRITLRHPTRAITAYLRNAIAEVPPPGFNLGPGAERLVVRRTSAREDWREACWLHWGFIPAWTQEKKPPGIVNARAETVAKKASFREAFRKRRCLLLADGFYEWRRESGRSQPFFFSLPDDRPFALAGIWEEWRGREKALESFCVLTTEPNELVAPVHDRMPVILDEEAAKAWLEPDGNPTKILRAFPAERMLARPVSSYVNKIGHEGPDCLASPENGEEQLLLF